MALKLDRRRCLSCAYQRTWNFVESPGSFRIPGFDVQKPRICAIDSLFLFPPLHRSQHRDRNVLLKSYWNRFGDDLLLIHHGLLRLTFYWFFDSCVGVWQYDNRVEIIANDQGNRTTPSCISFSDNGHLIGDAAKNVLAMNPTNTYAFSSLYFGCLFLTHVGQGF
jgi:hypothetical protein